jgi:hypothetical protein
MGALFDCAVPAPFPEIQPMMSFMHHSILTPLLLAFTTSCLPAKTTPWQDNLSDNFAYGVSNTSNAKLEESTGGAPTLRGKGDFSFTLSPEIGGKWNMSSVSILGLLVENTGKNPIIFDIQMEGENASAWENSQIARAILNPGEAAPLSVILYRPPFKERDPHYQKMIGRPNGHRGHWHLMDLSDVRQIIYRGRSEGKFSIELGPLFPYQRMNNQFEGVFPFIDRYGQYVHHDWPGKIKTDEDFVASSAFDHALEEELRQPTGFSKYGGWKDGPRFEATGFFRTVQHAGSWWFVDPEGYLFWSFGVTCVGEGFSGTTPIRDDLGVFDGLPDYDDPRFGQFFIKTEEDGHLHVNPPIIRHYDYGKSNLYRKYGDDWEEKSVERTIERMQYAQLNTIAAWSDPAIIKERKIPYTAIIHYKYGFAASKMPDPFDPITRENLRKELEGHPVDFRGDPWCIGVFVNNELHWEGNNRDFVAQVMGYDETDTAAKGVFREWLKEKYTTIEALNTAWSTEIESWEALPQVTDPEAFKEADPEDCAALMVLFADAYFKMVSEELKAHSPDHLYMGCRFHMGSAELIETAAKYVDVISANVYLYEPAVGAYASHGKPVIITEFHFTKTEGKLLGGGLRSAVDASQQARLFRQYVKEAIAHPSVIGAHWFQWKDQSVGGRWDGENYDLGFVDITDHPNETLFRESAAIGRSLYDGIPRK